MDEEGREGVLERWLAGCLKGVEAAGECYSQGGIRRGSGFFRHCIFQQHRPAFVRFDHAAVLSSSHGRNGPSARATDPYSGGPPYYTILSYLPHTSLTLQTHPIFIPNAVRRRANNVTTSERAAVRGIVASTPADTSPQTSPSGVPSPLARAPGMALGRGQPLSSLR